MRSFRAENVSLLVKQILDHDIKAARTTLGSVRSRYPIVITRSLAKAKDWLRQQARGSERYGIIVSSQAERLKPHAIDVKSPMDPVHWFLDGKEDVRSSYYLEDVATEFDIQGLELDWACVTWDGDFRHTQGWLGALGFRWQALESHKAGGKAELPKERLPCASDTCAARHGDRGSRGSVGGPERAGATSTTPHIDTWSRSDSMRSEQEAIQRRTEAARQE